MAILTGSQGYRPRRSRAGFEAPGASFRVAPNGENCNVPESHDERSAMALALEWAATVMTISAEMVLPGLAGYWVDQQLGTRVLFLLLGFAAGFVLAGLALARIAKKRTVKRDGQGYVRQSNDEHLE